MHRWKEIINIDGSKKVEGIHYDETYASVATWPVISMGLILSTYHKWKSRHIDFIQAFPQAPVEREIYMDVPKGYKVTQGETKQYALKILRNIYGQVQAGRVWKEYLSEELYKIDEDQKQ